LECVLTLALLLVSFFGCGNCHQLPSGGQLMKWRDMSFKRYFRKEWANRYLL
jgi:hypothetical protein